MRALTTYSLANQDDQLTVIEFMCSGCLEIKRATLLKSAVDEMLDEPLAPEPYCYNCEPDSWHEYTTILVRGSYPYGRVTRVLIRRPLV